MIKVLEVCTASSPCYALVFKRALGVMQYTQQQIIVDILCTDGKEVALMRKEGMNIITKTLHRSLNPLKLLQSAWTLHRVLRQSDYHVVHLHFGVPGLIGRILALFDKQRQYIYQSHGYSIAENTSYLARQLFLLIERLLRSSVRYSLFQLKEDIQLAKQYQLLAKEQIIYLGNGVDLNRFQPRHSTTISPNKKVIFGMVGRFEPIKNQALLIAAVEHLVQIEQHFKVLLIGQGPLKTAIQQQITQKNLQDYIEIIPYTHDMPTFYQSIDVGVLTSFAEGIPRALIEPMACGKPVLATDVKGSREALIPEKTGFLAPIDRPDMLAQHMAFYIQQPQQRKQMGKAAREHALQNYSEQAIIQQLAKLYQQASQTHITTPFLSHTHSIKNNSENAL